MMMSGLSANTGAQSVNKAEANAIRYKFFIWLPLHKIDKFIKRHFVQSLACCREYRIRQRGCGGRHGRFTNTAYFVAIF